MKLEIAYKQITCALALGVAPPVFIGMAISGRKY